MFISAVQLSDWFIHDYTLSWVSLVAQTVKNLSTMWRPGFDPWVGKIPWRWEWQPHSSILAWRIPTDRGAWRARVHGVTIGGHDWATKHRARILFSYSFPLWIVTECWIQFPVLYSRTLLLILSVYNRLHLLIPNSQSFSPLPFLLLGNHRSVLYVCAVNIFQT